MKKTSRKCLKFAISINKITLHFLEFMIEKNKDLIGESDMLNIELERMHQRYAILED